MCTEVEIATNFNSYLYLGNTKQNVFLIKFLEDISPFCGATEVPILELWWHLPWFSKTALIPHLHASLPVCNGFLNLTSDMTPADLLVASMAPEPFQSTDHLSTSIGEVWTHDQVCCSTMFFTIWPLRLSQTNKYQVVKLSPGGSFAQFACFTWLA